MNQEASHTHHFPRLPPTWNSPSSVIRDVSDCQRLAFVTGGQDSDVNLDLHIK